MEDNLPAEEVSVGHQQTVPCHNHLALCKGSLHSDQRIPIKDPHSVLGQENKWRFITTTLITLPSYNLLQVGQPMSVRFSCDPPDYNGFSDALTAGAGGVWFAQQGVSLTPAVV